MAFKFTIARKSESAPVELLTVDAEMCQHFNLPEGQDWHHGWVDDTSSGLVSGFSLKDQMEREKQRLDKLRVCQRSGRGVDWQPYPGDEFQHTIDDAVHRVAILKWLDDNFTACCWSPTGK